MCKYIATTCSVHIELPFLPYTVFVVFSFIEFSKFFHYVIFTIPRKGCMPQQCLWTSEDSCVHWFSPYTAWVLGVELREQAESSRWHSSLILMCPFLLFCIFHIFESSLLYFEYFTIFSSLVVPSAAFYLL